MSLQEKAADQTRAQRSRVKVGDRVVSVIDGRKGVVLETATFVRPSDATPRSNRYVIVELDEHAGYWSEATPAYPLRNYTSMAIWHEDTAELASAS